VATAQKVALHTLGCKVNYYDTEAIWQLFAHAGYERVDFTENADVYVINTCTVTHEGDRKSRQMIRRAVRHNPDAVVVVTGCYAQIAAGEVLGIDGVDLVVGNQYRTQMMEWIEKVRIERRPYNAVVPILAQKEFEDMDVPAFVERTRATLKIEDGCNHFCTFCIIPYARGLVRSRKPESVIRQARRLADAGYHEIVLTGIHTGGYGEDLEDYTLADLLTELEQIENLRRIRISSIEASEITDDLIQVLTDSHKICRHLHIPLQAGANEVLKRMNRHYTIEAYAEKLTKVRRALPDLAITSDIIVGFPGETDDQFLTTYDFVQAQAFAELHVFPYSPREGTPAAKFTDVVPEGIKHDRVEQLIQLSLQLQHAYNQKFVNQVLEVIPEDAEWRNGQMWLVGHADNYMKVEFSGDERLLGEICAVRVDTPGIETSQGSLETVLTNMDLTTLLG
jgi:threonylcarbamoyladenosine tRNA methylthiotransferase MtaB